MTNNDLSTSAAGEVFLTKEKETKGDACDSVCSFCAKRVLTKFAKNHDGIGETTNVSLRPETC